jgi:hypothetical protein
LIVLRNERHHQERRTFPNYTSRIKGTTRGKHVPKDISANMTRLNILGEPPIQNEDIDLHEEPVEDEERSLSSISTFAKTMTINYCLHLHAPLVSMRTIIPQHLKNSVPTHGRIYALIA